MDRRAEPACLRERGVSPGASRDFGPTQVRRRPAPTKRRWRSNSVPLGDASSYSSNHKNKNGEQVNNAEPNQRARQPSWRRGRGCTRPNPKCDAQPDEKANTGDRHQQCPLSLSIGSRNKSRDGESEDGEQTHHRANDRHDEKRFHGAKSPNETEPRRRYRHPGLPDE